MPSIRKQQFIDGRRNMIRRWRIAGPACLIMIVALIAWIWVRSPNLVNPWRVMERIQDGSMDSTTLVLLAAMTPILFLTCIGLLVALVLFVYRAFAIEAQYLKVIDRRRSR